MKENIVVLNKFELAPTCLYPTERIDAINDERVRIYGEAYNAGKGQQQIVFVIKYKEEYYIYEGHEQVLAALSNDVGQIEVVEIDKNQLKYWGDDQNFIATLKAIGMTSLYDFEAIGGFTYKTYPEWYRMK